MNKEEIEKQLAVLEIISNEIPFKYPKGSSIVFSVAELQEEDDRGKPNTYSCAWYDKDGKGFPLNNIIRRPPEWQSLTRDEAKKICAMFDRPIIFEITRV